MNLYKLENVLQCYDGKPVLSVDNWSVAKGSITGLYGPNGSGKSTLLRLLGFTESPARGKIYFHGRKAETYGKKLRTRVTLMPQESYLLKRPVYKNIVYGLRIRGDRSGEKQRVKQAMQLVGLDAGSFAQRPWYALSGGEARRVAMAARLILNPQVLLLDEPTASVDAKSAQMMKQAAEDAHRKHGTTLVIASHDRKWLEDICHNIVHMFNGKIMEKGGKTFIFGPWEKTGDNCAVCRFSDGQTFFAENAPKNLPGASAAVDPQDMTLHAHKQDIPPEKTALKGLLVNLCLEKPTNRINAAISVGHTEFITYLNPDVISKQGYYPGCTLWVAYNPAKIEWGRS
ncbi:MAG: energy-coupling factor ABC transporter ATP-binding protein [Desulfosalsimonas sp.]